ncbi:MAG: hypothetical protein NTV58_06700 [Deltaproteobacteria bacterium]|nr:hypothetical protein [Deltaproteobacteria bacterium]
MKKEWRNHLKYLNNLDKLFGENGTFPKMLEEISNMESGPQLKKKKARLLSLIEKADNDLQGLAELSRRRAEVARSREMLDLICSILQDDLITLKDEAEIEKSEQK